MKKIFAALAFTAMTAAGAIYAQSHVPASLADINGVIDNTPDSLDVARMARPVAGSTRIGDNPVLFLVGNSTMRAGTPGNGNNGQWGWGYFMPDQFDSNRITVENHALGGMSSRTFYNRLWADVVKGIRPGDWVIIELGHNDNGPYDSGRARASIPGIGNDSLCVTIQETGVQETVYTFGEYMRRMIHDVKACGGHPILMSLTPRNAWDDADSTVITRVSDTFGLWSSQVAEAEGIPFIDLNDITARKYERYGKDKVKGQMFYIDRIHTSEYGAKVNAESAAEGIRMYPGLALAECLKPVPSADMPGYCVKGDDGVYRVKAGNVRRFIESGAWDRIYRALQPGDSVSVEVDAYVPADVKSDETGFMLPADSEKDSKVFKLPTDGRFRVVYRYGWYLDKLMQDGADRGAKVTPVCAG
ncbi:MAG: rhamnogalacturonan acetylesterase [Bacteroides sp.]|nr:rhamnogalacturonan acetylesterase [Bacteroides sp.]